MNHVLFSCPALSNFVDVRTFNLVLTDYDVDSLLNVANSRNG